MTQKFMWLDGWMDTSLIPGGNVRHPVACFNYTKEEKKNMK